MTTNTITSIKCDYCDTAEGVVTMTYTAFDAAHKEPDIHICRDCFERGVEQKLNEKWTEQERNEQKQAIVAKEKDAAQAILRNFVALLLEAGMSKEQVAQQGFDLALELAIYLNAREKQLEIDLPPLATPNEADIKLKAAYLLKYASERK